MARRRGMRKVRTQKLRVGANARQSGLNRRANTRGPRKLTIKPGTAKYRHFPVPRI